MQTLCCTGYGANSLSLSPNWILFQLGRVSRISASTPFDALGESTSKWLLIEDGIDRIRISYDYTAMENKTLKEEKFDGQFHGVDRKHSIYISQNTKGKIFQLEDLLQLNFPLVIGGLSR